MATLEDCRPVIADLLDGLGMAAGADNLRYAAALDAQLSADELAELNALRTAVDAIRDVLSGKRKATDKLAAIHDALPQSL